MMRAMQLCEHTARSAQRSCAGFACHTAKITVDAVSASIFAFPGRIIFVDPNFKPAVRHPMPRIL